MNKLSGKIAIVTGAGKGIGREAALAIAAEGATVVAVARTQTDLDETVKMIEDNGGSAISLSRDLTDGDQVQSMVDTVIEKYGKIDILVNNAGGGEPPCDFFTITDERWDHYIRFNLYSAFYMIREVFPYMKKQKKGKIVNISSGYAIGGGDFCAHYASAKAGVIGLTTSIAKEGAPYGINVNVIPVPTTDTPGLREADFELVGDEIPLIPLGRIAVPEDIANTVLFLVSESADYVTGQIVAPNGGRRMLI